jgi:hypothetical protein
MIVWHQCQNCNVTWQDDGPMVVLCFDCSEELR